MQQIERGIFFEDSFLGVTLGGLVFSHGMIMIDAPIRPEDARSWRSTLLNQRGGANRLLINLDSHPDRTLGDRALDCTIVTHQKTAQAFRNRPTIFKGQNLETGAEWESYHDAIGMRWATPDITFATRMSLHWGGPEVILEHHPGPAPGAIWVVIPEAKVVFVGDAVVPEQPPFLANADLEMWLKALDELLASYRDSVIVSGRGGPVTVDAVRKQQRFLKNVMKEMDRLEKRNAPLEATEKLAATFLSEFPAPEHVRRKYEQRLRYGLQQYYLRRFHPEPLEDEEQIEPDEE